MPSARRDTITSPRRWGSSYVWLLCLFCLMGPALVDARERVGLVLSGGGARGLAHIGVLQALEKLRVPVDVIAGTSMGAVVGGLHAAGRSADDLHQALKGIDWEQLFSDKSPRELLPLRRKQAYDSLSIDPNTGITDKWQLRSSTGILQGQHLGLFLRQQIGSSLFTKRFDDLPIVYRAVTADLETGHSVVLTKGNLADAIQASMTVPGVFSPMPWGKQLLVDGGIANNLPIDVVQGMGVGVVIAVNISDALLKRENIQSLFAVADQMTRILIDQNVRQQRARLAAHDVYIEPALSRVSSTAFEQAERIVQAGYEATWAQRDRLSAYALSESDYKKYQAKQQQRIPQIERLDYVGVKNQSNAPNAALRQQVHQQPQAALDYEQLHRDLSRLYGFDYFSRVSYDLVPDDGLNGLIIQAQSKNWGPGYVRLGLYLEDRLNGENRFDLRTAYWRPNINQWGGELSLDLNAGGAPSFGGHWHQPLGAGSRYFASLGLKSTTHFDIYELSADYELSVERREDFGAFSLGRQFGNVAQVSLGVWRGRAHVTEESRGQASPRAEIERIEHQGFLRAGLLYDSLDHAFFPRKGLRLSASVEDHQTRLEDERDFSLTEISATLAAGSHRHRWQLRGVWGRSDGDFDLLSEQGHFALGGFLKLSGLGRNSRVGNRVAYGAAIYHHFFNGGKSSNWGRLFMGGSLEIGNTWFDGADSVAEPVESRFNARHSASLFAGTDTFLGPLYFAVGFSEGGEQALYLFLGNPN